MGTRALLKGPLCQEYILRGISLFWIKNCISQAKLFSIPAKNDPAGWEPTTSSCHAWWTQGALRPTPGTLDPEALGNQWTTRQGAPLQQCNIFWKQEEHLAKHVP